MKKKTSITLIIFFWSMKILYTKGSIIPMSNKVTGQNRSYVGGQDLSIREINRMLPDMFLYADMRTPYQPTTGNI